MLLLNKINKIALSSSDDKRMQSIDSIETFAYGTSKDLVYKKEKIKRNNIIQKIFHFDYITKEGIKEHNPNWPEIPNDPYRILKTGGSVFGKNKCIT